MCGLFGWLTGNGEDWHRDLADDAAIGAAARGPHGWGIARHWGDPRGPYYRTSLGPLLVGGTLAYGEAAPGVLIGQCRLATSGGPGGYDDRAALQPLRCDELAVAHNGVVHNVDDLVREHHLRPTTSNDSEVAGLYLAWALRGASDVLSEAAHALDQISPGRPLAMLALLPDGGILAASRGLPLHSALAGPHNTACYLSSRPLRDSVPLPRDSVTLWRRHGYELKWQARPLVGVH